MRWDRLWKASGLGLALVLGAIAGQQSASEYDVKAAFLYKFASFVEWPAGQAQGPLCIGILGTDRFGDSLEAVVSGKRVGQRGFGVQRFRTAVEAGHCEILFISSSEQARLSEVVEALRGKPVLTVSEVPGFCERGGIINLKVVDASIRFEINAAAGERAGLRFSSKLLAVARIVGEVRP